jgi:hypothetical protein
MTINRLWQSGAETGSLDESPLSVSSTTVSATYKYTGNYGFGIHTKDTSYIRITPPSSTRRIRLVGFWHPLSYGRGDITGAFETRAGGTINGMRQNSGNLYIWANGSSQGSIARANEWQHIGVDIYVHSSAGWVYIYRNGQLILSFDGNTGNADITDVSFGGRTTNAATGQVWQAYDDLYVDDITGESVPVPAPIRKFYYFTPNAAGNYTQWTPSSGSNYQTVDEVPPGDSDYVTASGTDFYDSYNMTSRLLNPNETAMAMIPIVRARRYDVTEQIGVGTRYSGTDVVASGQALSTGFDYYWDRQETPPGGGSWDNTTISGIETVIKSAGTF